MICEKCSHEWDGKMATCPSCGHLAAGFSGMESIPTAADPTGTAKLRLKFRDLPAQGPNRFQFDELPGKVSVEDLLEDDADDEPPPAEQPLTGKQNNDGETTESLVHEIADTGDSGVSYSFRKNRGGVAAAAETVIPKKKKSAVPPRRTAFKVILLLLALAAIGLAIATRPTCLTRLACWLPADTSLPPADTRSDIVQIQLTNVSGKPLILRIGNQIIALDSGQTMEKTVYKGTHDVTWRCDIGGETLSGSSEDETIAADGSWKFELVAREQQRQVIRTTKPN